MDLLPNRIKEHFDLDPISIIDDQNHSLVWVLTNEDLPEEKSEFKSADKGSLVRFISKIYKPILWGNIGIAFTTFYDYKQKVLSKDSSNKSKSNQVDDDLECFRNALLKMENNDTTMKTITESVYKSLPQPPKSFFRPGKKRESDVIEIENWKAMLDKKGYSHEDYRRAHKEYKNSNLLSKRAKYDSDEE